MTDRHYETWKGDTCEGIRGVDRRPTKNTKERGRMGGRKNARGQGRGKDKFGDRLFVYLPQHRRWVLDPEKPQGLRSKSKQEFTRNY